MSCSAGAQTGKTVGQENITALIQKCLWKLKLAVAIRTVPNHPGTVNLFYWTKIKNPPIPASTKIDLKRREGTMIIKIFLYKRNNVAIRYIR